MNKFFYILTFATLLSLGGCTTTRMYQPTYDQPSPRIALEKAAGTERYVRDPDNKRFNPDVVLHNSVGQSAETSVMVTFSYQAPRRGRETRTGQCKLHIKPADASQFNVRKCRLDFVGTTFIVRYKIDRNEYSFDINALNGNYVGTKPWFIRNTFFDYRFSSARMIPILYVAEGTDALKQVSSN